MIWKCKDFNVSFFFLSVVWVKIDAINICMFNEGQMIWHSFYLILKTLLALMIPWTTPKKVWLKLLLAQSQLGFAVMKMVLLLLATFLLFFQISPKIFIFASFFKILEKNWLLKKCTFNLNKSSDNEKSLRVQGAHWCFRHYWHLSMLLS